MKYVCYADPNLAPELAKASSDQIHELTRKTGGFKHTPAVGLDTTDTTKIFQLFFFGVHFIYALNDKQEFSWQKYRSSGTMSDIEQKLS